MSWTEIGKVGKPNGLKGAFILFGATSQETQFVPGMSLKIGENEYFLAEAAWMPKGWKITLEAITSPEQAQSLRGLSVQIPSEQNSDSFYPADIVGFKALSSGNCVGVLEGIETMPKGPDRWWFTTAPGKSFCVPAIENFIKKVDPKNKTIELENAEEFIQLSNDDSPKDPENDED